MLNRDYVKGEDKVVRFNPGDPVVVTAPDFAGERAQIVQGFAATPALPEYYEVRFADGYEVLFSLRHLEPAPGVG